MKKFTNHIDHVAWISWPENLEANIAQLEKLADAKLTRFERTDTGERMAGVVTNTCFILGDIDYADNVIPFGDAQKG